jgi:hypothetical protein
MRTHLPVLDNLARRRKMGIEVWIEEQKTFWNDNQDKCENTIEYGAAGRIRTGEPLRERIAHQR